MMSTLSRGKTILLLLTVVLIFLGVAIVKASFPLNRLTVVNEQIYQLKVENDNVEILLYRIYNGSLQHYDELSSAGIENQSLYDEMLKLLDENDTNAINALSKLKGELWDKVEKIEEFKSAFSIYKNSLLYLPGLFVAFSRDAKDEDKQKLITLEARLFRHILAGDKAFPIFESLAELKQSFGANNNWRNLELHADYVVRHHLDIQTILQSINRHPANDLVAYFHDLAAMKLDEQINQQRTLIYGFELTVLALLIFSLHVLYQYQKVNREVQRSNENLESKIAEATKHINREKQYALKANESKGQFMTRMSHELRTPLNAILGFAQLQQMQMPEDAKPAQKEQTDQILFAGEHLLALINEILDIISMDEGKLEIIMQQCDLQEIISRAVEAINPIARVQNIEVETQIETGLLVNADQLRLMQVMTNLLSNAVKFNHPGGKVQVLAKATSNLEAVISVIDTGVGMTSRDLIRIFDPFTRLDYAEVNEISGTGIGLTLAQRLAERMNGHISVESTPEQGSTFTLRLKQLANSPVKHKPELEQSRQLLTDTDDELVVMYIEDNQTSVNLFQAFVANCYPQVNLAIYKTAEEGVNMAMQNQPNIIFMDLNLPKMDGKMALSILKSEMRNTYFYALTADAIPEHIEQGLKLGFDGYITKPVDLKVLTAVFERHLPQVSEAGY